MSGQGSKCTRGWMGTHEFKLWLWNSHHSHFDGIFTLGLQTIETELQVCPTIHLSTRSILVTFQGLFLIVNWLELTILALLSRPLVMKTLYWISAAGMELWWRALALTALHSTKQPSVVIPVTLGGPGTRKLVKSVPKICFTSWWFVTESRAE